MTTALVKYKETLPTQYVYEFKLVDEDINLNSRADIKLQLPDILGRALARSWIDPDYKRQLEIDVQSTLLAGGITIPDQYICEYDKSNGQRAKIVVYEMSGKLKLKVCGLSLTMMATR